MKFRATRFRPNATTLPATLAGLSLAFAIYCAAASAQTAYRHRDANGQWIFSDQSAGSVAQGDSFALQRDGGSLHLAVDKNDSPEFTELVAVNDCLCVATFVLTIVQSNTATGSDGTRYRATLKPGTRQSLVRLTRVGEVKSRLQYTWRAALGAPGAQHTPPRPYRVPFATGSTFRISQAYPARFTHVTPDSQYAVDIALPDGTPIYTAREGTVIDVRHDFFRGAVAPIMLDQANVVQILHDDGTIAIYAHLHWDSVRVRIGQHVTRGQYIADSGNTGFTSGPHLHFAVIRNAGDEDVSVPIAFAGIGTTEATPATYASLTAY